jgi:hypothetical protein
MIPKIKRVNFNKAKEKTKKSIMNKINTNKKVKI